ncbi:MAG: hypothetical protein IPK07_27290 [Deltaproteobacteria bacterium]|nr:hypothetical protein [Deltaproteobacteria bacterium]
MQDGRPTVVTYDNAKHPADDWNAKTVRNPTNPVFGDIWLRIWRSQDDVPHIFRGGAGASPRGALARPTCGRPPLTRGAARAVRARHRRHRLVHPQSR